MKHPCVELYAELTLEKAKVRLWLKTDNMIEEGTAGVVFFLKFVELKSKLHENLSVISLVEILEKEDCVSAFQVIPNYSTLSLVVYREWP